MPRIRYLGLDAIRGIAALAVLVLHLSVGAFPHRGYLAVDVFFVLSGFVIAHAYETKLLGGLSVASFARLRAIRLYPLVELGIALAVVVGMLLHVLGRGQSFSALQILFGMLLLPFVTQGSEDMYLVLSPTWSLFNEMVVNLAYAAVVRLLNNRTLAVISLATGAVLVPAIVFHGSTQFGPFRGTLLLGLVRTTFSFSVGVLIYRLRDRVAVRGGWRTLAALGVVTLAVLAVGDAGPFNGVWDALAVTVAIPLVIALAAHVTIDGTTARACVLLGDLSYPVYVLHWPIRSLLFASGIQSKMPEPVFLAGASLFVCVCAYLALKLYDEPVRSGLARIKRARPITAP